MALSQIYTAVAGHVITAARWNNEFGNIYTNGTDVAFPLTKAVSLAGWTLTLDAAGVSSLASSASIGLIVTPGVKNGTPGINGSIVNFVSGTYTDTNTLASGTAALWTGLSIRSSSLAATNTLVTTTNAASLYIEGPPTASTNETITNPYALLVDSGNSRLDGDLWLNQADTRTDTVDVPLVVTSQTSGAPAAGIGTGIRFEAESQDETPSQFGQIEFAATDVTTGSEDTFFQVLLRVAGAALTACWRFVATGAFKGIFTHANTADRTYTLPNRNFTFGAGDFFLGPTSVGASSTISHEGTATIAANQALDGVHFYTNFTLNASVTLTPADNTDRLVIVATDTITINGAIAGGGSGSTGGAAQANGQAGYTQAGGGGGADSAGNDGGDGGNALLHGVIRRGGGAGGTTAGAGGASPSSNLSGEHVSLSHWLSILGGAGGGGGGGGNGGDGGNGGGSIVLVAPTIVLGAASALSAAGANGSAAGAGGGGGGGGGAGNIYIFCQSYTDNGCTFTVTGGSGGAGNGGGGNGAAGSTGVRQINIYAS